MKLFVFLTFFLSPLAAMSDVIEQIQTLPAEQAAYSSQDINYRIVLPEGAQDGQRYPVIYWLPGKGTPFELDVFYESGFGFHTQRSYRDARDRGLIRDVVMVYIDSGKPVSFWGNMLPQVLACPPPSANPLADVCPGTGCPQECSNGETTFNGKSYQMETAVIRDLIPYIEERYPVKGGAENRVVVGYSMGGYGAVLYGLKYPSLFRCAVSIDGALVSKTTMQMAEPATWRYYFGRNDAYFTHVDLWGYADTFKRYQNLASPQPRTRFAFTQGGLFAYYQNFFEYWTSLGLPGLFRPHPELSDGSGVSLDPAEHLIGQNMARDGDWVFEFVDNCYPSFAQ